MADREHSDKIGRSLATLRIIWGAMLFSLAIYLFIGVYMSGRMKAGLSDQGTVSVLRAALYAASLMALVFSKILRSKALAKARGQARLPGVDQGGGADITPVLTLYATAMIISLALSESVAVYGLVLAFMGGDTMDLFTLVGVAAAAMVYYRPRREEVLELTRGRRPGGSEYRTAQRD